jgi:hypothetical protein
MEHLMELLQSPPPDISNGRKQAINELNSYLCSINPEQPHFMSEAVVNAMHVKGHAWCGPITKAHLADIQCHML